MDILYSINIAVAIGDHQRVVKEGTVLLQHGQQMDVLQEAKVLFCMWRAHISLGEVNPVSKMSKLSSWLSEDHVELREALALFSSFALKRQKDDKFDPNEFAEKAARLPKLHLQSKYVAALILFGCGFMERSFDLIRSECDDLDCQLLIVSILMAINRPDAAIVRLEDLKQRFGEDARLQMVEAGVVNIVNNKVSKQALIDVVG